MNEKKTTFEALAAVDCSAKTKKKGNLTYLSWPWAWAEVKKRYPDASYTVRHWDDTPYFHDEKCGYLCETSVTINGEKLDMWLPVMDARNKAIMQPTMYEINKTIMRCLVKNLAMFGLGLFIYAGEDLPEESVEQQRAAAAEAAAAFRAASTLEELTAAWNATPAEVQPQVKVIATQCRLNLQQTKK